MSGVPRDYAAVRVAARRRRVKRAEERVGLARRRRPAAQLRPHCGKLRRGAAERAVEPWSQLSLEKCLQLLSLVLVLGTRPFLFPLLNGFRELESRYAGGA